MLKDRTIYIKLMEVGKNEKRHHTPLRYVWLQAGATAVMLSSKDGRRVSKLFWGFEKIYKSLLAQSGITFDGQLAFFVVRSDQQGNGIGKQLFTAFCNYMKSEGLKNFYLYTDSKCNFGFYEHQGLVRIRETLCSLKPQFDEELQLFLYEYRS